LIDCSIIRTMACLSTSAQITEWGEPLAAMAFSATSPKFLPWPHSHHAL